MSTWIKTESDKYHGVEVNFDEKTHGFEDEDGIADWSTQRFLHIMDLREKALTAGRLMWADFVWVSTGLNAFFSIHLSLLAK